jgi:hypothetical protein
MAPGFRYLFSSSLVKSLNDRRAIARLDDLSDILYVVLLEVQQRREALLLLLGSSLGIRRWLQELRSEFSNDSMRKLLRSQILAYLARLNQCVRASCRWRR